jgi:hypothetical protein
MATSHWNTGQVVSIACQALATEPPFSAEGIGDSDKSILCNLARLLSVGIQRLVKAWITTEMVPSDTYARGYKVGRYLGSYTNVRERSSVPVVSIQSGKQYGEPP